MLTLLGGRLSTSARAALAIVLESAWRDSLLLNIVMLIHPIEAVKRWQLGN